jgi:hypothetical protein
MLKLTSLAIGLLTVIAIAPKSEAMSANNIQPQSLQQPAGELHAQVIFKIGTPEYRYREAEHRREREREEERRRNYRRYHGGYHRDGDYRRDSEYRRDGGYRHDGGYRRDR